MRKILIFCGILLICSCSSTSNNRIMKGKGLDEYVESPCACILEIGFLNEAAA